MNGVLVCGWDNWPQFLMGVAFVVVIPLGVVFSVWLFLLIEELR